MKYCSTKQNTYPLSPVASTKFFHSGCSHIKSAASAVSVHQHKCLLNSSFLVNLGRKVAMALRMLTSEASGYVSDGCFAADLGTEMRFGAFVPYGWCCLKRVKPGNSSQTLMTPCSSGSKKKPTSPLYTTGAFLYSAASLGVSWMWAYTHAYQG